MLSITPIGSCRINTPLRIAAKTYSLKRNLDRVYGYCHSSAEAVQQVKFLLGEYVPAPVVEPFISPNQSIKDLLQTEHQLSDLYIVELSSAKQLTLEGECVQMNYLSRYFQPFFANKTNASQFWKLAQLGNQNVIDQYLEGTLKTGLIDEEAYSVLRKLRYKFTTPKALREDVEYLLEKLPEVLFVSHVNAVKSDGLPITSREKYINQLKATVAEVNGALCDPTDAMDKVGQEYALEDSSTSLAHFTEAFSTILFDDWHSRAISPLIDRLVGSNPNQHSLDSLIIDLAYQVDKGAISQATSRIESALDQFGQVSEVAALNARCLIISEGHQKAVNALKRSLLENPTDPALLTLLFEGTITNGESLEAYKYFKRLRVLGQNLPMAQVLPLARNLETDGHLQNSLTVYSYVTVGNPELSEALEAVARIALAINSPAEIESCARMLIENQTRIGSALTAEVLLRGTTQNRLKSYLRSLAERSSKDFLDILTVLNTLGQENMIAEAIAEHAVTQKAILRSTLVRNLLKKWETDLQEDIPTKQKFAILNHIQKISTLNKDARATTRELRTDTLSRARILIKAGDVDAVVILHEEIMLAVPPILDVPIYLSRHYYKIGNNQKSLEIAQAAHQISPDHGGILLMVMRSAFRLGEYLVADQAAARIIELAGSDTSSPALEAQKRFNRLPALCLRASRKEPDPFKAWTLAEISARDETLTPRTVHQFNRIKKQMGARVREMQKQRDPEYLPFALKVDALTPDFEIVLQSLGRHFVSHRQFDKALPFWARLSELQPNDEVSEFQLERCRIRAPQQNTA